MPVKRLLTEFGMGSSLRRQDYTEAASRAVKDALWHNSINLAELYGKDKSDMMITVEVGVQDPDAVDTNALAAIFPYGQITVTARKGGLDVPRADGGKPTVIANVAISVALDLEGAA
ncbi:MAG: Lin0512 family protein [Pelagibaca sp.]